MSKDPGGVFDSDTHRRTLGHLAPPADDYPFTLDALFDRLASSDVGEDTDDLLDVLKDLEADGYASQGADGWRMTTKGLDAINAPPSEE